jgi:pimeloyl-ACP methyl ester carboxylesterase
MSNIYFVPVNGAQLAVEDSGGSDVVILLHGFASDRSTWDFVWDDLANAKRAIRYDLRGFGNSICDNSKYRHAEDLLGVLDVLNALLWSVFRSVEAWPSTLRWIILIVSVVLRLSVPQ